MSAEALPSRSQDPATGQRQSTLGSIGQYSEVGLGLRGQQDMLSDGDRCEKDARPTAVGAGGKAVLCLGLRPSLDLSEQERRRSLPSDEGSFFTVRSPLKHHLVWVAVAACGPPRGRSFFSATRAQSLLSVAGMFPPSAHKSPVPQNQSRWG